MCADGIGATARADLLPEVTPAYAGYVAGAAPFPRPTLTPATHAALHDAITYQVLPGSHILVYPIPGPTGRWAGSGWSTSSGTATSRPVPRSTR